MSGSPLCRVGSLTSCSSLQLLHVCLPTLPHARCTCKRHEERLGEGGKEEVHVQPCVLKVWRVSRFGKSSVQRGFTYRHQLPPTSPRVPTKAVPCLLHMQEARKEAGEGWGGEGTCAAMFTPAQVPQVRRCVGKPYVLCGVTHTPQQPPTAQCSHKDATHACYTSKDSDRE